MRHGHAIAVMIMQGCTLPQDSRALQEKATGRMQEYIGQMIEIATTMMGVWVPMMANLHNPVLVEAREPLNLRRGIAFRSRSSCAKKWAGKEFTSWDGFSLHCSMKMWRFCSVLPSTASRFFHRFTSSTWRALESSSSWLDDDIGDDITKRIPHLFTLHSGQGKNSAGGIRNVLSNFCFQQWVYSPLVESVVLARQKTEKREGG